MAPDVKRFKNIARDEQPFLPDLAWAYFSAYITIIFGSYMRLQFLKTGVEDPERYVSGEAIRKVLKVALPHQARFIDENEPETYYNLLDEIERSLLGELRKILEGREADQAAALRAKEIMDAVRSVNEERAAKITGIDS
jgi:hypothetical protein